MQYSTSQFFQPTQARDAPLIRELTKLLTKLTLETTAADATADSDNKFAFPAYGPSCHFYSSFMITALTFCSRPSCSLKKSYALLLDLRAKFEDTIGRIPDLDLSPGIDNIGTLSRATLGEVAVVDSAKMDVGKPLIIASSEGWTLPFQFCSR